MPSKIYNFKIIALILALVLPFLLFLTCLEAGSVVAELDLNLKKIDSKKASTMLDLKLDLEKESFVKNVEIDGHDLEISFDTNRLFDAKRLRKVLKKNSYEIVDSEIVIIGKVVHGPYGALRLKSEGDQTEFILYDEENLEEDHFFDFGSSLHLGGENHELAMKSLNTELPLYVVGSLLDDKKHSRAVLVKQLCLLYYDHCGEDL